MTYHYTFSLLIFPFFVMSAPQEYHTCTHIGPSTAHKIHQIQSVLHQNASLQPPTTGTNCLSKTPPSIPEMTEWLNEWSQNDVTQKPVNSLPTPPEDSDQDQRTEPLPAFLQNETPKMIELFQHLTKGLDEPIQTECENVTCVSQQLFGEKQGTQILYMLAKYGFNGSPFPFRSKKENRNFWTSDELDNVLIAFSHLPENLFPMFYNRPLIRYRKGYTRSEYADRYKGTSQCVRANSYIEVFDCIHRTGGQDGFIQTMVHELAHVIGSGYNLDDASTWLNLGHWEETKTYKDDKIHVSYELKDSKCVVSEYGKTSPAEDFAESVVHYRYSPSFLKTRCPEKYNYIKDFVFNQVEYTTEKPCK